VATHSPEPPVYGGRALARGVLMVGPGAMAVSVRAADGSISTAVEPFQPPFSAAKGVPFLRGLAAMAGAVVLALKSARMERRLITDESRLQRLLLTLGPIVSVSLLESVLRQLVAARRGQRAGPGMGVTTAIAPLLAFRLSTVVSANRQLLQYHAAEHMAVHAVEAGRELTPEGSAPMSRIHPRCGTSFAVWVIVLNMALQRALRGHRLGAVVGGPLSLSLGYEIAQLGNRKRDEPWARYVFGPAWGAQLLTTSPPTDEQLEVACSALKAVIDFKASEAVGSPGLV